MTFHNSFVRPLPGQNRSLACASGGLVTITGTLMVTMTMKIAMRVRVAVTRLHDAEARMRFCPERGK